MTNRFDEMREAVKEARYTIRAADSVVNDMADMVRGRLKHVSPRTLK